MRSRLSHSDECKRSKMSAVFLQTVNGSHARQFRCGELAIKCDSGGSGFKRIMFVQSFMKPKHVCERRLHLRWGRRADLTLSPADRNLRREKHTYEREYGQNVSLYVTGRLVRNGRCVCVCLQSVRSHPVNTHCRLHISFPFYPLSCSAVNITAGPFKHRIEEKSSKKLYSR